MRLRGVHLVMAIAVAAATLVGAPVARVLPPATANAAGTFADPHFREIPVLGGLDHPTAVRFAADGRAFVAEKRGVVKAFDSIDDTTPTTVVDLRTEVMDFWDRGMLGMVLDPQFLATGPAARPYLYLYYVEDATPGDSAPVWNDACYGPPTGPGPTTDGCIVNSNLVRYTIDTATNVAVEGSGVTLVDDWCAQFMSHNGGGMIFGKDGQLYVSGGDGASYTVADYGQRGGTLPDASNPITPINPCHDQVTVTSPAGVAPVVDVATAEGGALRSQDLRTPDDPVTLDGSLIRVDPDTGHASAGNPLAASNDLNARRIVAYGFRNPFRLAVHPDSGDIYVGDVGNNRWEEVDRVVPPAGAGGPVPNYGWPCYEGVYQAVPWPDLKVNLCENLYDEGLSATKTPVYTYYHAGVNPACGTQPATNASITGLAFYEASGADQNAYPSRYDGALFFVDYARDCMVVIRPGPGGVPDPATTENVASGIGNPVDLVIGPHGDLYYVDLDDSRVVRVRYAPSPVAHATVTPVGAKAPVTVTLDASSSSDPDLLAGIVAWDWDLDNDGSYGGPADKSGKVVQWDVVTPAIYPFTLRVTSSNGLSDTVKLSFDGTNQLPVPQIDEPAASLTWSVDDVIEFSGSATDEEDGALPPSALKWTLVLHHCVGLTCHEHTVQTLPGVASGSFQAPDHEYPSHLELRLTAKDDDGGSTTTSVELQPKTTTLDVASVPAGVRIDVGDQAKTSPSRTTLIRGGTTTIVAPAVWSAGSNRYRFATWSDGKARAHEVTVTDPASRSATYVPDAADACSAAKAITPGAWVSERTTAGNDVDWFKLTLSGRRRVVVTLGDLPVNAKLELYGACSSRLASTDHAGTRFERLTRSLPAGTYRVRVSVPSGTRSMTPWSLRVLVVNDRVALESRTVRWTAGTARVVGRVVNGTGGVVGRVAVVATFKDAQGRVVGTLRGTTFANRLPDGDASSFALSGRVPAFVSVAYSLRAGRPGSARALTLSSLGGVAGAGGTVMETGSVRNTGRVTLTEVRAERTWLGKRGEALDVRSAPVSPSTLAPGASGTFKIVRPALANLQATATALRAR